MAENEEGLSGYDLSRFFWDFCFENPEKVSPNHCALYFFSIEHCNRLGWKEKFGLPTNMAKEAIGIKNYKTYSKTLNDLVEWNFIKMIEKSKNQYSANIVALVKNTKASTKASTKALDKARLKHTAKQVQSIVSVDKPLTLELLTIKQENTHALENFLKSNCPNVLKMKIQATFENLENLEKKYSLKIVERVFLAMENKSELIKKYNSVYLTATNWCDREKQTTSGQKTVAPHGTKFGEL